MLKKTTYCIEQLRCKVRMYMPTCMQPKCDNLGGSDSIQMNHSVREIVKFVTDTLFFCASPFTAR